MTDQVQSPPRKYDNFEFFKEYVVVDYPEYKCLIHEHRDSSGQQMLLCHMEFHRFSKAALARLLREWAVFRKCVTAPLFAHCPLVETKPAKWERFVQLLGFQPLDVTLPGDYGPRKTFVHYVRI